MRYASVSRGGEQTERKVDPYAIVPYVRSFHLVGYCHLRQEVRIFKVDRIKSLQVTRQQFQIPDDFDLKEYIGDSWGLLRGAGGEPEEVRLRFSPRAGRWVSEEQWHPGQQVEWQPDGTLIFSLRVAINPAFVRWILYYGSEVEVIEPEWLAREVWKEARDTADRYKGRVE
jgi:predicted DNA-binding transcriptional regulator YafY